MSIADKLRKVLEIKNDIKTALEAQGVEVTDDFSSFATEIASIETGSGGGSTEPEEPEFVYVPPTKPVISIPEYTWEAPSEWTINPEYDLKQVLSDPAHQIEGYPYRIAQLIEKTDSSNIIIPGGGYIKTSEGTIIQGQSEDSSFDCSWNNSDDKYRWVIYYYSTQSVKFGNILPGCLHIVIDGATVTNKGSYLESRDGFETEEWGNIEERKTIVAIEVINGGKLICTYSSYPYANATGSFMFNGFSNLEYLSPDIFDYVNYSSGASKYGGLSYMFSGCSSLISVPEIKTTGCKNFDSMFSGCSSLKEIPELDTSSGTSFNSMFSGCSSLKEIPELDTSSGTNFSYMFHGCRKLRVIPSSIKIKSNNISNVFYGCTSLEWIGSLDLSEYSGSDYSGILTDCTQLKVIEYFRPSPNISTASLSSTLYESFRGSLNYIGKVELTGLTDLTYLFANLSGLNAIGEIIGTENVNCFNSMFEGCGSLYIVPDFDTSSGNSFASMFNYCYQLRSVPLYNLSNSADCNFMFNSCTELRSVPLFDIGNVQSMEYMFSSCNKLKTVPHFNTSNCINFIEMFSYCYNLESVPLFDTSQASSIGYMFRDCQKLKSVPDLNTKNVGDFNGVFSGCINLESVPNFDYSMGYTYNSMFHGCSKLKSIPYIDTSRAFDVGYMFAGCNSLESIPNISIDGATCIMGLFSGCKLITSIPDTITAIRQDVSDISQLFDGCESLESIPDLGYQGVSIATSAFANCPKITSIPSSINWANLSEAGGMFAGCSSLKSIEFGELSNISNISGIVYRCSSLNEFNISVTSPNMQNWSFGFEGCDSLYKVNINAPYVTDCSGFLSSDTIDDITVNLNTNTTEFAIPVDCRKLRIQGTVSYPISSYEPEYLLKYVYVDGEIRIDQNFTNMIHLTKQSILNIINALAEGYSCTLTLGSTNLEKLTEEEKAFATNKGWQLA